MALTISIVTPSYNQAEFLEATLQSVLAQDYPSVEYLVMDGGSTDGSQQILGRYVSQLAYFQSRPDRGQTDALIQGFGRATGQVIAWLNSDDVYEPGVLSEVAVYFEQHPKHRFVFGDATWIDRDGAVLRRKREMPFNRFVWLRTYNYIRSLRLSGAGTSTKRSAVSTRRSILRWTPTFCSFRGASSPTPCAQAVVENEGRTASRKTSFIGSAATAKIRSFASGTSQPAVHAWRRNGLPPRPCAWRGVPRPLPTGDDC